MRITVFAILAVHVVVLGVLLIAGCNKKTAGTDAENTPPPPPVAGGQEQWPTPNNPLTNDTVLPPIPGNPGAPIPVAQTSPPVANPLIPGPGPGPGTEIGVTPVTPGPGPGPTPVDASAPIEHTIVKGETLATIGKKYSVGYKAIEAANPGINPTRLKPGDKIKIPAKTATAAVAPAPAAAAGGGSTYVVKSGDNLLKIAKSTGVPVKQLRAANNLRTDQIRVGQKLKIPARSSAPVSAEATSPPPVAPPVPAPTGTPQ